MAAGQADSHRRCEAHGSSETSYEPDAVRLVTECPEEPLCVNVETSRAEQQSIQSSAGCVLFRRGHQGAADAGSPPIGVSAEVVDVKDVGRLPEGVCLQALLLGVQVAERLAIRLGKEHQHGHRSQPIPEVGSCGGCVRRVEIGWPHAGVQFLNAGVQLAESHRIRHRRRPHCEGPSHQAIVELASAYVNRFIDADPPPVTVTAGPGSGPGGWRSWDRRPRRPGR